MDRGHGGRTHSRGRGRPVLRRLGLWLVLASATFVGIALAVTIRRADERRSKSAEATLRDHLGYAIAVSLDAAQWDIRRALRARLVVDPRGTLLSDRRRDAWRIDAEGWRVTTAAVDACRCLAPFTEAFTFRLAPARSLAIAGTVDSLGTHEWVSDTLAALLRDDADTLRVFELFAGTRSPGRALAARVVPSPEGPVVYGYAGDVRPWLAVALPDMLERAPLFPRGRMERRRNVELIRFVATSVAGDTLFDSHRGVDWPYERALTVRGAEFGGTIVHAIPGPEVRALFKGLSGDGYRTELILGGLLALHLIVMATMALSMRREAERERRRRAFASTVSHELRTPLAQILLFAERLREARRDGREVVTERQEIDVIVREAEHMRYLVENALHAAAGPQGSLPMERARMAPTLEEIVDRHQALAHHAGTTVTLDLRTDFAVDLHRGAVEQVTLNLLDNAIKHGRTSPRRADEAAFASVVVGLGRYDGVPAFWVDDDGPGLPIGGSSHLWELFERGPEARLAATPGNGLGLAVVRDLVTALGWSVVSDVSPLGGARFVVKLVNAEELSDDVDAADQT